MTAFFFGPAHRQLFGYYHPPAGNGTSAVVICPSWGPEYQYAHRALRVLARRLAERGAHVLRFDYSGTGDSWGDSTNADAQLWLEDISLAIAEVQAMSGLRSVDLVGLRYGACLAAGAAAERPDVRRVALWDPICDGPAWLRELAGVQDRAHETPSEDQDEVEFSHRVVSSGLLRQFASVAPTSYDRRIAEEVMVLFSTPEADRDPLAHLENCDVRLVPDVTPWVEDTSIWSGLVPAKAVSSLVDWLVS